KDKRERFAFNISTALGDKSAGGIIVNKTNDLIYNYDTYASHTENYYHFDLGVVHAINEVFTVGIVANDLMDKTPNGSYLLLGGQYVLFNYVSVMLDTGFNFKKKYSDTLLYRGALQLNIFQD